MEGREDGPPTASQKEHFESKGRKEVNSFLNSRENCKREIFSYELLRRKKKYVFRSILVNGFKWEYKYSILHEIPT